MDSKSVKNKLNVIPSKDLEAEFAAKLKAMQVKFKDGLAARINELVQSWVQVKASKANIDELTTFHSQIHTLTGSAGTFLFKNLSTDARVLELYLKGLLEGKSLYNQKTESDIEKLLEKIQQTSLEKEESILPPFVPTNKQPTGTLLNKVLIIDDDIELNEYLTAQLEHFGYDVTHLTQLADLEVTLKKKQPDLIISDINFPEGDLAGTKLIHSLLKKELIQNIPIIFISSHQDIIARLEAVRANGSAYFTKPINISSLVNKIGELTQTTEIEPYHVLVVDDDPSLVDLTTFILQQSGMDAHGITTPLNTLEQISLNKPDLILMDVHMPDCSGIEMAQVIRQKSSLSGIPIIFLSSESDSDVQFKAVLKGGDDFLTKPVDINTLPAFITSKAKRAREINALMIRDGLTGLYNHSYTKEMIDIELERSKRSGIEFSIAMLDIDFFKKVNDSYGHMVGDQVLRSLSHFLLKRLRKTDKIGRYGGEEFIIILSDTPVNEAMEVMNSILSSFREIVHFAENIQFQVTFSCGVISSNVTSDANLLIQTMDQALYKAKEAGRNQVVLAELNDSTASSKS